MGDFEEKQKEIQAQLEKVEVRAEAGDGAVSVTANANKKILNIAIDKNKIGFEDVEEVEDLILTAVNRALEKAGEEQSRVSQGMINDLLPGFGGLFGGQ